jgi:hypothetical protein
MYKNKGFGVVSGSAAYIATQRKEAEHENTERLIHNMSNDFPALARIYAKVKEEKKCM